MAHRHDVIQTACFVKLSGPMDSIFGMPSTAAM
jgi:hypothetical protein